MASFGRRLFAFLLDFSLFWLVAAVFTAVFAIAGELSTLALFLLLLWLSVNVWWFACLFWGQTPGKALAGIRTVRCSGEDCGWGRMFLREFVLKLVLSGPLSLFTLGICWLVDHLWPVWDRRRQTVHDKIAGTLVVRDWQV